jgi:hypothetical protein
MLTSKLYWVYYRRRAVQVLTAWFILCHDCTATLHCRKKKLVNLHNRIRVLNDLSHERFRQWKQLKLQLHI